MVSSAQAAHAAWTFAAGALGVFGCLYITVWGIDMLKAVIRTRL